MRAEIRIRQHRPALAHAGYRSGCLNCGPNPARLSLHTKLCMGFGIVAIRRDGQTLWCGDPEWDEAPTLRRWEHRARREPQADWRVEFWGPLSETVYQRHARNRWVLIARGLGFA